MAKNMNENECMIHTCAQKIRLKLNMAEILV